VAAVSRRAVHRAPTPRSMVQHTAVERIAVRSMLDPELASFMLSGSTLKRRSAFATRVWRRPPGASGRPSR
jgi:hypothetical protein